jgi:stage II sporulation protein D
MPASRRARPSRALALLCLVALAALAGCAPPHPATPVAAVTSLPASVRVRLGTRIVTVPLEDYVLGSALAEVSPVGESVATISRVYQMQAILARTYAVSHLGRHRGEGFDLCDTTHCQLYEPGRAATSRFTVDARAAVAATRGEVLWYAARPIEALFHSDCGGYTAAPETIWGGSPVAYLRPLRDQVPALTHHTWQCAVTREALRAALNADARSAVGERLDALTVVLRDVSGRAAEILLKGERAPVVRGEDLRTILGRAIGPRGLQSTRFAVTRRGSTFVFEGSGYGHGVGLCQLGAMARARRGETVADILAEYFPGARLAR